MKKEISAQKSNKEPAPFFKSWNWWYALVLLNLAALIAIFYLITKTFE